MPGQLVAPLAGAWIEIKGIVLIVIGRASVAPLAGAWIEMVLLSILSSNFSSLPSRERGLKSVPGVAVPGVPGRSPRGSVD